MEMITKELDLVGKQIKIEVGKMAKQADGAVLISSGGTSVLVTAVADSEERKGANFLPLTVDVEERMYAAGKIPGGFFRREGRPGEASILNARLTDRALRPNFSDNFRNEVQVIATILSADQVHPPDVLVLTGASAALSLSNIPFDGPLAAVRVGRVDGKWVINPTFLELEESQLDLIMAGNRDSMVMVEADAYEIPDDLMVEALKTGQQSITRLVDMQSEIDDRYRSQLGEPSKEELIKRFTADLRPKYEEEVKRLFVSLDMDDEEGTEKSRESIDEIARSAMEDTSPRIRKLAAIVSSVERRRAINDYLSDVISGSRDDIGRTIADASTSEISKAERDNIVRDKRRAISEEFTEKYPDFSDEISEVIKNTEKNLVRDQILSRELRPDGRKPFHIRKISCEVGLLEQTHGSAMFTRGETQVLTIVTLGAVGDKQRIDNIGVEEYKRYIHHYNFPPYCTGEARFLRGPKRREIGHGALAERALLPVIPEEEDFPYTIRLVSEVLESNGSSSMASVCGSTLALMDAGVPLSNGQAVAGIAMGLVSDDGKAVVLSDIQGSEDAAGEMDFKVAGTGKGLTALQLDLKRRGIPEELLTKALDQAREGLNFILKVMHETIPSPRQKLSQHAPKMIIMQIPVEKIGDVIGPGGKTIRRLISDYGITMDVEDDGKVFISSSDGEMAEAARRQVELMTRVPVVGEEYIGRVVKITSFGAFVEILPGTDGLLHISKLSKGRVDRVEDVLDTGDRIKVKIGEIDSQDRINLDLVDLHPGGEEG